MTPPPCAALAAVVLSREQVEHDVIRKPLTLFGIML
jgi:hypothetical protein